MTMRLLDPRDTRPDPDRWERKRRLYYPLIRERRKASPLIEAVLEQAREEFARQKAGRE